MKNLKVAAQGIQLAFGSEPRPKEPLLNRNEGKTEGGTSRPNRVVVGLRDAAGAVTGQPLGREAQARFPQA